MIENGVKMAFGLGFLALCAGVIALFFSYLAWTEVEESKSELEQLERLTELADRIREFERELRDVAGGSGEAFEALRELARDTEEAFRRVADQRGRIGETISGIAEELGAIERRVAELEETVPLLPESAPAPSGGAVETPQPDEEPEESGEAGRTYRIQSGDTLDRISREFGVSVNALEEANPGVDPLRLQIGQEIRIPQ